MIDSPNIVRYEPALALSLLFRPLQARNQRPRHSVTQAFNGLEFEWVAPQAPGVPEQTLLLVLAGLAGPGMHRLPMEPTTPVGHQLRDGLSTVGELFRGETASIQTTMSELARRCGSANPGGANLQQVREMLKRLAEITVWIRSVDYEASSRLLSVVIERLNGNVRIALNTRLAMAAWGDGQYVTVSMAQRLALSSQTGMALHAFLSGVIQSGKTHAFAWPRLERGVWGNNTDGSTYRGRKRQLSFALNEIARDGWTVVAGEKVVTITRHSANKTKAKHQQATSKKSM